MITADQLLRGGPSEAATLDRPLDHLVACHRRIEQRLDTLERVGQHYDSRPEQAREALTACFRFFDTNGLFHTQDEEESLFPRLRARLCAEELAYLDRLERDHDEAHKLYSELKAGPADLPRLRELIWRLCELYRRHIASEDEVLTELGRRLLTAEELRQISQEMRRRRTSTSTAPESSAAAPAPL